jgi:hypothetical protein
MFDAIVLAFEAVVAPVRTTAVAAPWVSVTLCVVEETPVAPKVKSYWPTVPSRRRFVKVATPEPGVLVKVPVIVAVPPPPTRVAVTETC